MDGPRHAAWVLRSYVLTVVIGTALATFVAPTLHTTVDAQSDACAPLRSRPTLSPIPDDRIERAAREREIRACLAEIRNDNQTAWQILQARDPNIFRAALPSELRVDGVTAADLVTALDTAARRRGQRVSSPVKRTVPRETDRRL